MNPDALEGAAPPDVRAVQVAGADLHVEVRGSGPGLLIVGAADEDAEIWRGLAERLAPSASVATYDRRGTGRSSRQGWPCDSATHADDAAHLIRFLGPTRSTVFGASAGGIVALRLALGHPELVENVVCFEPGLFGVTDTTEALRRRVETEVEAHLAANPDDWLGATAALGRAAVSEVEDVSSLFTPPPGREWFSDRCDAGAEALIRGELGLTREPVDLEHVGRCPVNLRFAYGSASLPAFREIASRLAGARGEHPDVLDGVGHLAFHHLDLITEYLRPIIRQKG